MTIEDDKRQEDRATAYYEAPMWKAPRSSSLKAEDRVALALEYIAYQLYDIRQSARKLADRQNPAAPEGE